MLRRIAAILTVVAAVVVLAAGVYVIVHKDPVPDAGKTPGFRLGSDTSSPAPSTSTTAPASNTVVAFLGDDYTAAAGSASGKGFVTLLGSELGVTVKPHGVTGGGYAKQSSNGEDYSARVNSIVADKPDVVVVTGGRNDVPDSVDTLKNSADDLFKTLHDKLPNAVLVAVAPFWGDSDAPSGLDPVAMAIKDAVEGAKGTYLDVMDPLNGHPSYMKDATDPNDKGYAAIATALKPKLEALLPAS